MGWVAARSMAVPAAPGPALLRPMANAPLAQRCRRWAGSAIARLGQIDPRAVNVSERAGRERCAVDYPGPKKDRCSKRRWKRSYGA